MAKNKPGKRREASEGQTALKVWQVCACISNLALADSLGVSATFISHLRTGERKPGRRLAFDLQQLSGGAVPVEAWDRPVNESLAFGTAEPSSPEAA